MSRYSVMLLNVCLNGKIFCIPIIFQNIEVLAVEETSGFTCILILDSGICHYLAVSAKTEKQQEKPYQNQLFCWRSGCNKHARRKERRQGREVSISHPFKKKLNYARTDIKINLNQKESRINQNSWSRPTNMKVTGISSISIFNIQK